MIIRYIMNWSPEAIVCLLLGLGFVIAEFILPGFTGLGIAGAVFLVAAVAIHARSLRDAVISCVLISLILVSSGILIFRSMKSGRLSRLPIILKDRIEAGPAFLSAKEIPDMTGRVGTSLNLLRPCGNADFDGMRLDVITSGEFIEKGRSIRIERIEGTRILVREVDRED
jgi:membrane-bound ClpP family serine protease